jgi:hypothetical protein
MNAKRWSGLALLGLLAMSPAVAGAVPLNVEVWTDRGNEAVYQPDDRLEVSVRPSEDAYLMVYEIDAEGGVRLLFPFRNGTGFVEGHTTYTVPPPNSNVDLVVDGTSVGQCYIVAIASRDHFKDFPWYLRPYDLQAEQVGYQGQPNDEEGITSEGKIVGDPFVAMERIRRRVVASPDDPDAFGTGYTTYYVHEQVRYPRYLCYDCHRPGRWAWWSDFDPYYTHCSVFDFRINWGWCWGPTYWFGTVPYYCYVPRYNCPPYYRPYYNNHTWFSSWNGWGRWNTLWGDHLVRFKTAPPPGYVPPSRYPDRAGWRTGTAPPGFITANVVKGREGMRQRVVVGRGYENSRPETQRSGTGPRERDTGGISSRRGGAEPAPSREVGRSGDEGVRYIRPRDSGSPSARPSDNRPREEQPRNDQGSGAKASGGGRRADPAPSQPQGQQLAQPQGGATRSAGGSAIGRGGARFR